MSIKKTISLRDIRQDIIRGNSSQGYDTCGITLFLHTHTQAHLYSMYQMCVEKDFLVILCKKNATQSVLL